MEVTSTARTFVEIVAWLVIGFCVSMALFEFLTRPRGPTRPTSLHLRDDPSARRREPSDDAHWKNAA